jgi:hypothetical protein
MDFVLSLKGEAVRMIYKPVKALRSLAKTRRRSGE